MTGLEDSASGVPPLVNPAIELIYARASTQVYDPTPPTTAESLGIGSCYIGDILEPAEEHAALFGLSNHTMPVTMLCFGRSPRPIEPRPRYVKHVVHTNTCRRMTHGEAREMNDDLRRLWAPHELRPGLANQGQDVYRRKFTSGFMPEMNRSVAAWIDRWQTPSK